MTQQNVTKAHFRFQDLDIWKMAFRIANRLYDVADRIEERKLYRFAEQLRGSAMSLTNNISEGSGAGSINEFRLFLNYTRRSIFECANIILTLSHRNLIEDTVHDELLKDLDHLSRKVLTFSKSLK
ncbi:MAG: four helix bundle protein [Bacteroidota bacterium]